MNIQRIVIRETNCYLLRAEGGVVLIDPGPPGGAEQVIAEATRAGIQPDNVKLILVTHGHLDHYGAAADVKAWCGAPVACSPGEAEFSQNRRNALPPAQTLQGSLVRWFYLMLSPMARFRSLEVDHVLDEGSDLSAFGLRAEIIRLPGHSPGSLGVVTEEGAFVGDLFVNYTVPSQPIYLSDRVAWRKSYKDIQTRQPRMVYVGHGEPFPGAKLDRIYSARYQMRWWVR